MVLIPKILIGIVPSAHLWELPVSASYPPPCRSPGVPAIRVLHLLQPPRRDGGAARAHHPDHRTPVPALPGPRHLSCQPLKGRSRRSSADHLSFLFSPGRALQICSPSFPSVGCPARLVGRVRSAGSGSCVPAVVLVPSGVPVRSGVPDLFVPSEPAATPESGVLPVCSHFPIVPLVRSPGNPFCLLEAPEGVCVDVYAEFFGHSTEEASQ